MTRRLDSLLLILVVFAIWQVTSWSLGAATLASPEATARTLVGLLGENEFWQHVAATLRALVLAVVISMVGGVGFGVLLGAARGAGLVMEPILVSLYALPKITLYPLVLLIFGLGISAKVAFGAMHGLVPVLLITMNAVRQLRPSILRTARVMRLTPWQCAWTILLPATLPDLLAALRLGFSLSLLGVLIGEMFAAKRGLGFMVMNAVELNDLPRILSVIIVLFTLAIGVNSTLLWLGRRLDQGTI
jgi:NitT/TauT family transport system permease protein